VREIRINYGSGRYYDMQPCEFVRHGGPARRMRLHQEHDTLELDLGRAAPEESHNALSPRSQDTADGHRATWPASPGCWQGLLAGDYLRGCIPRRDAGAGR
jgi:hypothetical protein